MKREEQIDEIRGEIREIHDHLDRLEAQLERVGRVEAGPTAGVVPTFVEGMDAMLGGGLPAGHVVFLQGPPGAMKTSLALTILALNKAEGRRCLHLTLEEDRESLRRTMGGLGLDGEDFIVDIATLRAEHGLEEVPRDWLDLLQSYLEKQLQEGGLDLLVIDPFDALYAMGEIAAPRRALFRFFRFLRGTGITALLLFEDDAFFNREDHMADGVLKLAQRDLGGGAVTLWVRCPKMRHAVHSRDFHRLEFREGKFQVRSVVEG